MIDIEGIKEERLTREEIARRIQNREDFCTAQLWGMKITNGLYVTGSSALMNDDGNPGISAIINWQNTILSASPLTNIAFYEEMLAL